MAAAGTWTLVLQTPIGERTATLVVDGSSPPTGTLTAEGRTTQILDAQEAGTTLTWKATIKSPMQLTLDFKADVDGTSMTGTVSAPMAGTWSFTGNRA